MKNTPRRKREKTAYRLISSRNWIKSYEGNNIVKGYANWYGVDLLCAIKELRMNAVQVEENYENAVKESIESRKKSKQLNWANRKPKEVEMEDELSDDRFAFIAGYTSGGFTYGIPHEEMKYNGAEDEIFKD